MPLETCHCFHPHLPHHPIPQTDVHSKTNYKNSDSWVTFVKNMHDSRLHCFSCSSLDPFLHNPYCFTPTDYPQGLSVSGILFLSFKKVIELIETF